MRISQPWRFINCFLTGFITGVGGCGAILSFTPRPYEDEPESSATAAILGYMLGGALFIGVIVGLIILVVHHAS